MKNFKFQGSNLPTIGVEIELQILDPETLNLTPRSEELLKLCKKNKLGRVKAEIHQSMLEIDSEISTNVKECRQFLSNRLIQLNAIAESEGLQLGVTGTHPFQEWKDRLISNIDRYQHLHEKFQWLARRMNVYGLHVHVGMPNENRALSILQAMIQYLPIFLALSANSPFWQGIDTGMQSSRISIMESFPYAGLPPCFEKWSEFEHYCDILHRNGAIGSLKDLYWFVRPSLSFGTIEFRICDAMSTLTETMSIVALIHCLATQLGEQLDENPLQKLWTPEHHWVTPYNQWIAARDGLEGIITIGIQRKKQKISDHVLELVEQLSAIAENLNCLEELNNLKKIVSRGNGAQRQRAIYAQSSSLQQVVAASVQEFKDDFQQQYKI